MRVSLLGFATKLSQWVTLSPCEKGWLLLAFMLLGFCRSIILVLPMRFITPYLGHNFNNITFCVCPCKKQIKTADRIGRMIRIAANYTFWESTCLIQAMVARILLGFYQIPFVFYFGVSKDSDSTLKAHAWVCSGPVFVSGGNGFERYTVTSTFASCKDFYLDRTQ